ERPARRYSGRGDVGKAGGQAGAIGADPGQRADRVIGAGHYINDFGVGGRDGNVTDVAKPAGASAGQVAANRGPARRESAADAVADEVPGNDLFMAGLPNSVGAEQDALGIALVLDEWGDELDRILGGRRTDIAVATKRAGTL